MLFETQKLIIRPLQHDDLPNFHDMKGNPNVMRYIKATMTYEESQEELYRFIRYYDDKSRFFHIWAVETKENPTLAGICGVYQNRKQEFEIAYRLRERFWGRGIGKEIAKGLIRYCFETIGLEELTAYAARNNTGSVRILEQEMAFADEFYSEEEQSIERKYHLTQESWRA